MTVHVVLCTGDPELFGRGLTEIVSSLTGKERIVSDRIGDEFFFVRDGEDGRLS